MSSTDGFSRFQNSPNLSKCSKQLSKQKKRGFQMKTKILCGPQVSHTSSTKSGWSHIVPKNISPTRNQWILCLISPLTQPASLESSTIQEASQESGTCTGRSVWQDRPSVPPSQLFWDSPCGMHKTLATDGNLMGYLLHQRVSRISEPSTVWDMFSSCERCCKCFCVVVSGDIIFSLSRMSVNLFTWYFLANIV